MSYERMLLLGFSLLWAGCSRLPGEAAGPTGAEPARVVSGMHRLSTDARYDAPCQYVKKRVVADVFGVAETGIQLRGRANNCEFSWGNNRVILSLLGDRPFPSIYHAEYVFDRLYQPRRGALARARLEKRTRPQPLSDPGTAGLASERPIRNAVSRSGEPLPLLRGFVVVSEPGDKAIWEPGRQRLHVLYDNHIVSVHVQTADREEVNRQRAVALATAILGEWGHRNVSPK